MPAAESKPKSHPTSSKCWICRAAKSVVQYIGDGDPKPRVVHICQFCDAGNQMLRYTRPPEARP